MSGSEVDVVHQGELLEVPRDGAEPLDAAGAEALTVRIKTYEGAFIRLVHEAWVRKAHLALGYESWAAYVEDRFRKGRSHAYRLVEQGLRAPIAALRTGPLLRGAGAAMAACRSAAPAPPILPPRR